MNSLAARSDPLHHLFPKLGPAATATLLADFATSPDPSADDWRSELSTIVDHRLAATAIRVIRERALEIDPEAHRALQESAFAWAGRMQIVALNSSAALEQLERSGIRFAVTKGPTIARFYPSVMERPFVDLDVLVRPIDFWQAIRVLRELGYEEPSESLMPWPFLNRHGREAVNLGHPSRGSIDLHHHVPPWLWSGSVAQLVVDDPEYITACGIRMPAASAEQDLLIAALHVVSDKNRPGQSLIPWRDLLVLSRACDARSVVEMASAAGLTGWLRSMLGALPMSVRPTALIEALSENPAASPSGWRLRHLLKGHAGGHVAFSQPLRLPAPNAAAWLGGMMLPSPAFLRRHLPSTRHRYRAWYSIGARSIAASIRPDRASDQLTPDR